MINNAWVNNLSNVGGFQSEPDVAGGATTGFWASVTLMPVHPGSGIRSIFGNFDDNPATQIGYDFRYTPGGGEDIIAARVGVTGGGNYSLSTTLTSVRSQALCLMLFVGAGADALMELYINGVLVSAGNMAGGVTYEANPGAPLFVQNDDSASPFLYMGAGYYDETQAGFASAEEAYYMIQQTGGYDAVQYFSPSAVQRGDLPDSFFWTNAWNSKDLFTGGVQSLGPQRAATPEVWPAARGDQDLTLIDPAVPGVFFTSQHTQWYQPSLGQAPTTPVFQS